MIKVIDNRGRTLTPCKRKVADKEVRLNRAKWIGRDAIRLRFDPFAYRYIRLKVLQRDNHVCYWCGGAGNTMDHVIPWSKGGRTTMNNCICACEECNGQRGDTPAEEFASMRNVPVPRPEGGVPATHLPPRMRLLSVVGGSAPATVPDVRSGAPAESAPRTRPQPVARRVALPAAVLPVAEPAAHPVARRVPRPAAVLPVAEPAAHPVAHPGALAELLDPLAPPPSLRLFY